MYKHGFITDKKNINEMIYIIGNTEFDFYKIGYTLDEKSFKKRLSLYNTHTPFVFDFIQTFKGGFHTEKTIHKTLSDYNIRGEWFYLNHKKHEINNIYLSCYKNDDTFKDFISKDEQDLLPF